jgi:hypothetical protein
MSTSLIYHGFGLTPDIFDCRTASCEGWLLINLSCTGQVGVLNTGSIIYPKILPSSHEKNN